MSSGFQAQQIKYLNSEVQSQNEEEKQKLIFIANESFREDQRTFKASQSNVISLEAKRDISN